ncbi:MAG TPA: oxygen-dependent coproporphyrinogen oxidase [Chitinophagales bacterium]|nr:oxygen-dependent coproporphyrinogen oxidase [Chitinophagales bacterium]
MKTLDRFVITDWFMHLQDRICHAIEKTDGKGVFEEELWQRPGGGGGRTRIIQNANIIEKGGVNFSQVHGVLPEKIAHQLQVKGHDFFATGVSIVMHPFSPLVPIIHMNVRYFEVSSGEQWFGGGIDLTPIYVDPKQAQYFHQQIKHTCDLHDHTYYETFKKWADDYFFIKHRNETRGVGGVFFDRLGATDNISLYQRFEFVKDIGNIFAPIYTKFMEENKDISYGKGEKQFQAIRRGRYVEFNLVYDKGTKFGLDTDGRTESILMSMPPEANWLYNYQPLAGSKEAATLAFLRKDVDWISIN